MVPYDGDDEATRDMVVKAKVVETGNDSELDPGIFIIFSDEAQLNGIMRAGKDKYEELLWLFSGCHRAHLARQGWEWRITW